MLYLPRNYCCIKGKGKTEVCREMILCIGHVEHIWQQPKTSQDNITFNIPTF